MPFVTEAPFAETSEQIGGLHVLDCADPGRGAGAGEQMPFSDTMSVEVPPAPH